MFRKFVIFNFFNLLKNKSIHNFLFLSIIQASNILITLISMPLLITSIGIGHFGLVNLAFSVIIIGNIFVSFGFNLSGPREVAINQNNKEKLSYLLSNVITGKVILATVVAVILFLLIFGFNLFIEYQTILAFSVLILFSEATLPLWFFQGMEKMKLISLANLVSKFLYLLGILLFIQNPSHAKWVNFILGGCGISINLIVLAYVRRQLGIVFFRPKISQLFQSLKSNVNYFLTNLTSYLTFNGGLVILSFFTNSESLGMYSLAEKIIMVIRLFPSILTQSVYPNASKLYISGSDKFIPFMRKAYFSGLFISMGFSVFTYLSAPIIIQLLAKSRLDDSIYYLRLLSLIPFFACLNMINVLFFLITNRHRELFGVSALMCIYMAVTAVVLASNYGVTGVCIALLSAELLHFVIFSFILFRKEPLLWHRFYYSTK